MAYAGDQVTFTLPAGADLSSYQYCAVTIASGVVSLAGAGEQVMGILLNKPAAAGDPARICISGICKHKVDGNTGAITGGTSHLKSDAAGRGLANTTDNALCYAVALEDSAAANDIIAVQLDCPARRY